MTTSPRRAWLRVAAVAVGGGLFAAALLGPAPDRDALVAQALTRHLVADLQRAQAGAADAEPSLFAAVTALAASARVETAGARIEVDGVARRSARLERAVVTQWDRYRAVRAAALPSLDFATGAADLSLALFVRVERDRVAVGSEVARGDARRRIASAATWPLPGRSALLPPLIAVLVGLAFGRTLLALFLGIWVGAVVLAIPSAGLLAPLQGLLDVFRVYFLAELFDTFRVEILGFIVALIAMVGVVSRSGGLQGMIDRVLRFASSARAALGLTAGLGLSIFFDDYANCVLVGSTMRPVTDRLRVSREKLAYVVDSTAAPVAAISLLSTWIAFQVSVFAPQLPSAGITASGYEVFVAALPYRFYCLLTLFFVFCVIATGRDFGPMARAEARARATGALVGPGGRPPISEGLARMLPDPGMPHDWRLAVVPLVITVAVTLGRIFLDGGGLERFYSDREVLFTLEGMTSVAFAGSGAGPIFAGAVAGLLAAAWLAASNALRLGIVVGVVAVQTLAAGVVEAVGGFGRLLVAVALFAVVAGAVAGLARGLGMRTSRPFIAARGLLGAGFSSAGTLAFAAALLFEAWMIGAVCRDLATADYLVALLSEALPPALLPVLLFALASLVAFATGSSWSTMSILLPNVVALAATLGAASPLGVLGMVALCVSAVLEGSVFGDHCSPISDTTVLSSVAAGSDHIDHVRTQAPYALSVALVAVVAGYLPLLGIPGWGPAASLAVGAGLLLALIYGFGRRLPEPDRPVAPGEFVQ